MTAPHVTFEVTAIGVVESALQEMADAPPQADEGAPSAWLVLYPAVSAALLGMECGAEIVVLTWLDRADRHVLRNRPRSDPNRAEQGVFTTRSPDRPNPIGLHRVTVEAIDGNRVQVSAMEAIDETPILDIKPVLTTVEDR